MPGVFSFVVPDFPVNSFSQGEERICKFWMLSVLRLMLTVSPVRAFMNISIFNINEHIDFFFFFLSLMTSEQRGFSNFHECRVFVVPGFQL